MQKAGAPQSTTPEGGWRGRGGTVECEVVRGGKQPKEGRGVCGGRGSQGKKRKK